MGDVTAPLTDLENMIQGLELPLSAFSNVTALRTRLLNDLVLLGLTTSAGALPVITDKTFLANISGLAAQPIATTLTAFFDAVIGTTRGGIITRNNTGWVILAPGSINQVLTSGGAGADLSYTTVSGLTAIADLRLLANISGGSALPIANTLSAIIDACISSTRGTILYRGAGGWSALPPGTSGDVLTSQGAGADPVYAPASGAGGTLGGASVIRAAAQTITAATSVPISWDTTVYDTDSYFSGGNPTRLTVPATGIYLLNGYATFTAQTGISETFFRLNGTDRMMGSAPNTWANMTLSCITSLTIGDFVELIEFANGGATTRTGTGLAPAMQIERLR